MPLFDLPLEELKTYQGRNPRPRDHEEFWHRSMEEMRAVEARVEFLPAEFQAAFADCYDLSFTGVGGARVHAKYIRPRGNGPFPALLQFHGYSASSGNWHDKLSYVAAGCCVASLDVRGQGGQSEDLGGARGRTLGGMITRGIDDDPERMYFRRVFLDTAQLAGIVMNRPEVDESRVGAMGASQGGALALVCGALEPRIRRVGAAFPFLADYQRVMEMDLAKAAYEDVRTYFRQFDPRHHREGEIYAKLGYIDIQHLAHRIRGEVLMGTGLMDDICPPSTQFAVYNKITAPKRMALFPDYGHEEIPGLGDELFQFMTAD